MTIYHIVENQCYQRLTNGLAIPNFAEQIGVDCKTYHLDEFVSGRIDYDSSPDAVFITESAFFRNSGSFTPEDLRKKVPNGKIINLGSDSILFNTKKQDEFGDITLENFDIWLDTMPYCASYYKNKGFKTDLWDWTISEKYIEQINSTKLKWNVAKKYDYICLGNLNSPYRKILKESLDKEFNGCFGVGTISSDLVPLHKAYNECYVSLGTSSPAGSDPLRTMKGFRDWIAPFFGTVLIYDDFTPMMKHKKVLPTYKYNSYDSLAETINSIKSLNRMKYLDLVQEQQEHIVSHTLEKQYHRIFSINNLKKGINV